MLLIDTAALSAGTQTLDLRPEAEALDLDPTAFSAIALDVQLDYRDLDPRSRRLYLRFHVTATAHLVCDRTLAPFDEPVEGTHTLLYVPTDSPLLPDDDSEDDDVRILPDDLAPVDIADAVRETLLLALPMRRVAPEARDQDLPTSFGALTTPEGTPIDARWEALLALSSDDTEGPDTP
ncbi:MAG: DUF177 domain-containing protein [Bacteroidota bacterium]